MRAGNLLTSAAWSVLIGLFVCLAPVGARGRSAGLEGRLHSVSFSRSVPGHLSYQGYLVEAVDSSAVNATVEMTFRLFDSQTEGTQRWAEVHPSVQVSNGLFEVLLGSLTPFPEGLFDGSPLWLQTEVEDEVLSPRKPLTTVAYGMRAETADGAVTAEWAADAGHAVHADTAAYSQTTASLMADSAVVADNAHHLAGQTLTDLDDHWVNEGQASSVTGDMIVDGLISDADLSATAAIAPSKIQGTAWTADNDGSGSGLDADLLDGQQAADFLSTANDYGRSGVSASLYEGTTPLGDKYLNTADLDHLDAADGDPASALSVDDAGNVGIGTASPMAKLDVAGTVKMAGVQMATGAASGHVLTSDATGQGTWQPAAGGADGDWTISGADMYSAVSGHVGIGTTGPAKKLHVAGDILLDDGGGETEVVFVNSNNRVYKYGDDFFVTADDDLYLMPDDDIYIAADGSPNWVVFDNGQKRVGIGTTAPSANLDVLPWASSYTIRSEWDGSSAGAALLAKNTGTDGDAIQANADGTGRSAIFARGSSGVDYAVYAYANGATWSGYFSGKAYVSDQLGLGTTSPQNKLDVEGAMVVGSSYSGSSTAPSNGMLVQGRVGMGTTSPGNHQLYVQSSASGTGGSTIFAENDHSSGIAGIFDGTSSDLVLLVSQHGSGDILRCDSWTGGWHPVFTVQNDGRVVCSVLELTGGSDLSEPFEVQTDRGEVAPGMLVCIDPQHPGELVVSRRPYDHRVAGVISGAGGIRTGMLMGQCGSGMDGSRPVALTGRVYCWADASWGPIQPGDLLTTSGTPGHAMKVSDHARAQGAVIGKAMSSLERGKGLVLVLVTLQ